MYQNFNFSPSAELGFYGQNMFNYPDARFAANNYAVYNSYNTSQGIEYDNLSSGYSSANSSYNISPSLNRSSFPISVTQFNPTFQPFGQDQSSPETVN
jgi:hypothetical protein